MNDIARQLERHLRERGCPAFYTGNALWSALFGLAFSDVVFAEIPGVFYNEFQRGPAGLTMPGFYQKRRLSFFANGLHPGRCDAGLLRHRLR